MKVYYGRKTQIWMWLLGFAHIIDGIAVIFTLGFYEPGLTSTCYERIMMSMFKEHAKRVANAKED